MSDYKHPKREYAVRVQTVRQHSTTQIVVSVMVREDGSAHPRNPSDDGEAWHGGPKLLMDGLVLRAFQSSEPFNGRFEVYDLELMYSNLFSANAAKCEQMVRTIRKVKAAIDKARDVNPRQPDVTLRAFCKALGIKWTVTEVGGARGGFYSDAKWQWTKGVDEAVDQLLGQIDALRKVAA